MNPSAECIDIILVGPWSRVSVNNEPTVEFLKYLKFLRSHIFVKNIIYSSSDSLGVVPRSLFDYVVSNEKLMSSHEIDSEASKYIQNAHSKIFYINSCTGINLARSSLLIKVRSDLFIKDLNFIYNVMLSNPNRMIVDYQPNHSLLIPYYYPDFLFAYNAKLSQPMFQISNLNKEEKDVEIQKKTFNLNPIRSLTAGNISNGFKYTEFEVWTCILRNYGGLTSMVPNSMSKLRFCDFYNSLCFLKSDLILVSRKKIFEPAGKFNFDSIFNRIVFKNGVLSTNMLAILLILHLFLFFLRSVESALLKSRLLFRRP